MYILLFIILFLTMTVYAAFEKALILSFQFDTDKNDMHLTMSWLHPLLAVKVAMSDYSPQFNVYFFNLRILTKTMQKKPKQNKNFVQYLVLSGTYANIYYGLSNPFNTAVADSVIEIIRAFTPDLSVNQYPDFIPDEEYIVIKAGSKLNISKTAVRFVRSRYFQKKIKRSDEYGSVQYD